MRCSFHAFSGATSPARRRDAACSPSCRSSQSSSTRYRAPFTRHSFPNFWKCIFGNVKRRFVHRRFQEQTARTLLNGASVFSGGTNTNGARTCSSNPRCALRAVRCFLSFRQLIFGLFLTSPQILLFLFFRCTQLLLQLRELLRLRGLFFFEFCWLFSTLGKLLPCVFCALFPSPVSARRVCLPLLCAPSHPVRFANRRPLSQAHPACGIAPSPGLAPAQMESVFRDRRVPRASASAIVQSQAVRRAVAQNDSPTCLLPLCLLPETHADSHSAPENLHPLSASSRQADLLPHQPRTRAESRSTCNERSAQAAGIGKESGTKLAGATQVLGLHTRQLHDLFTHKRRRRRRPIKPKEHTIPIRVEFSQSHGRFKTPCRRSRKDVQHQPSDRD